jgi:hypothetical protein
MSRPSIGRVLLTLAALFTIGATVGPDLLTPTQAGLSRAKAEGLLRFNIMAVPSVTG